MRLTMIDRIVELEPGSRITAIKSLSLSEDYLRDHFPGFPVMPGVLMLEAMYQTAAWLFRATDGFQHSLVLLAEANRVKFSDFVEPGQILRVTAELLQHDDHVYCFNCQGEVAEKVAVRGRLVLQGDRLSASNPAQLPLDRYVIETLRKEFSILYPAGATVPARDDS